MPVTWEIRGSVLIVTLIDECGEEPANAIVAAMADPRFQPGTSVLLDVRLCSDSPTSDQIRPRARWLATLQSKGLSSRFAMVSGPRAHEFGLARMCATHLELQGLELEIFTEFDDAMRWLANAGALGTATT